MAISVVGTPSSSATTTVTPATHAIGDYIVIVAMRSATTAPTLPAGYTSIVTATGNSNSYRVGYKIATSTTDASGTWTNASLLLCTVYRGVSGIGVSSAATHAAATTSAIPTLTLSNANSKSWVVAFAGHAATSTQGTPLTGATTSRVTQTSGTYNAGMFDTNAGVSSFSATTSSNTTSVVNSAGSFELISADAISTFTDPMSGSTQNTTLWGGNFGTLSWSPSGFTITNPISYTGYGGETSKLFYDLTGSSFIVNMPTAGNQSLTSCETVPFALSINTTNYVEFYINAGFLFAQKNVNGTSGSVGSAAAYNSSTMSWFKLSESGGTITWAYGNDGVSWTTLASAANPIPITALQIQPSLGTFSAEASSTTAVWNSFNPSSGVNATVTQVAANVTATGGTQSIATINDSSISQSAATLTTTGGTQAIVTTQSASITQVAGTLTATTGTQTVKTNTAIAQSAANLTATTGIQSVATVNIVAISQVAANITAAGGLQAIHTIQDVQIAQVSANATMTGGTQSIATVNNSVITQVGSTITATGGTQAILAVQIVSISQSGANITATGGLQSVSSSAAGNITITQTAATLTTSGGTQTVSGIVVQSVSITQAGAQLSTTTGTPSIASMRDINITQIASNLTITEGTQTVIASNSVTISQLAANVTATGGVQSINSISKITINQVGTTITVTGGVQSLGAQIDKVIAYRLLPNAHIRRGPRQFNFRLPKRGPRNNRGPRTY